MSRKVVLEETNGQWKGSIFLGPQDRPISIPDLRRLKRVLTVTQRHFMREQKLSQVSQEPKTEVKNG